MLDSGAEGPGFKSQLRRRRVTVLGKLFTSIVPLLHQAAKLVAALLGVARVTAGLAESNGAAYRRVYDSRHLQADCKEPGSAPELYARQSSIGYLYLFYYSYYKYDYTTIRPTKFCCRRTCQSVICSRLPTSISIQHCRMTNYDLLRFKPTHRSIVR